MRITIVALLALCGFIAWMAGGAPVPGPKMVAIKPDARVPTFQKAVANDDALRRAAQEGRLAEAPRQHELRQAVLDAASTLDLAPCDEQARATLRRAVSAFIGYQHEIQDKPPAETLLVDGRTVDARSFFNTAAGQVWRDAMAAGIVEGPGGTTAASRHISVESRFVCERNFRQG